MSVVFGSREFATVEPFPWNDAAGRFWLPGSRMLLVRPDSWEVVRPWDRAVVHREESAIGTACQRQYAWGPAVAFDCIQHESRWLQRWTEEQITGERDDQSGAGLTVFSDDGLHAAGVDRTGLRPRPHVFRAYRHGGSPAEFRCNVPELNAPRPVAMRGARVLLLSADPNADRGLAAVLYDVERREGRSLSLENNPNFPELGAWDGGVLPNGSVYLLLSRRQDPHPRVWLAIGRPEEPLRVRTLPPRVMHAVFVSERIGIAYRPEASEIYTTYDAAERWIPAHVAEGFAPVIRSFGWGARMPAGAASANCGEDSCEFGGRILVRLRSAVEPVPYVPPQQARPHNAPTQAAPARSSP